MKSIKPIKKSKLIAYLGLLLALDIVLTRFLQLGSAQFPLLIPGIPWRVDFGYVPASICAALFGPWWGALEAITADLIGFFLVPVGGPFFPGYSILAVIRCIIYGLFLYHCTSTQYKEIVMRCILTALCVAIFADWILKSLSDVILYNNLSLQDVVNYILGKPIKDNLMLKDIYLVTLAKNLIPMTIKLVLRSITLPIYLVWVNKHLRKTLFQ